MALPESQTNWMKKNTILVSLRVNKNQDPELFKLLSECEGSKGAILRELLNAGMEVRFEKKANE